MDKIEKLPVSLTGRLLYRYLPYRKSVIMGNIDQVFKDTLNSKQKKHLARAFYSHLAKSLKEMFLMRFISLKKLEEKVDIVGVENVGSVLEQGRGVLILTGHFGNWEYAPIGGILNFKELQGKFHFIRRTLGNKFIERILFKRYYNAGLNVIPKKNSLEKVIDVLEKNHAVVFVLDQHASIVNRDGVAADFFGKKAGTYRSLASFSRHTGVPVIPAAGYRLENGRHVLEFHKPIPWEDCDSAKEALVKNTTNYNKALEQLILAHPEQWLWLHKRWKLKD